MTRVIGNMTLSAFLSLCACVGTTCRASDAAQAAQAGSRANDGAITAPSFTGDAAGWGAAASDDYLATLRGGFGSGPGLTASFGIDRAVYVNGNLVTSSSLYIPNIGQLSTTQAGALAAMAGTINVIQNGPGDRIDPSVLAQTNPATVVQNTLNNQRIQTLTTINTTVNTLDSFKSLNLQNTLQSALVNSLGH